MPVGPSFQLGLTVKTQQVWIPCIRKLSSVFGDSGAEGGYHGSIHDSTMPLLQERIYLHENTILYKLKTNLEGFAQACLPHSLILSLPLSPLFGIINKGF